MEPIKINLEIDGKATEAWATIVGDETILIIDSSIVKIIDSDGNCRTEYLSQWKNLSFEVSELIKNHKSISHSDIE